MHWRWIFLMALRDGRTGYKRLLLYMSSIVVGVAAIVAVPSFGDNLSEAVDEQAKELLGADLSLRSNTPFGDEERELFEVIGGDQSEQVSFSSMVYFPVQEATRLVQVRALEGRYPYYGELITEPPAAARRYQEGAYALVDETLMIQFGAEVGDEITLGSAHFEILGKLRQSAGDSVVWSQLAPRIYIPAALVGQTGLVQYGSRVSFTTYFKLTGDSSAEEILTRYEQEIEENELRTDTVEKRKQRLGRQLSNLDRFLTLVGFVALVLGGVGVSTSINLYIRQRFSSIAILRCVGASPRQTVAIYLVQTGAMGLLSVLIGSLLGILLQRFLPSIVSGLVPVEMHPAISWPAVLAGMAVGFALSLLFALIPLAPVRRISPLLALRTDIEDDQSRWDVWVLVAYASLLSGLLFFSLWLAESLLVGLGFFAGLITVFALLHVFARVIMTLAKRSLPSSWRYEFRQGLANLYRPHNQTTVLVLALGLGTFLLLTIYLTQASLLREVDVTAEGIRPNLILFDIQTDQKEAIEEILKSNKLELLQNVPIVTMRLSSINDRGVQEIRDDPEHDARDWALFREYRSTYREELVETEQIVEGSFQGVVSEGLVEVSIERGIAEQLGLSIGDRLEFDVQGVPVATTVGSIRAVAWRNFQPNFFVVFPTGVLEQAPQFHVFVTRTGSPEISAEVQRSVVRQFPNVSAIDLSLIIETIDSILDKVVVAIRFMAIFCMATAFVVLSGAIVSGRYQRLRESALLRALGASGRQIHRILLAEYSFLGLLSALMGVVLALVGSWSLTTFLFETAFVPSWQPILGVTFGVVFLTVIIGMLNSHGILEHPPMEVLRAEE